MASRTMTAEQRAAKNARDRERRAQRAAGASVAGKPERKPSSAGGRRKPSHAELKRNTASVLMMANYALAGTLPRQYHADLLQPEEVDVLAAGIAAELHANPRVLAYFQKMAAASGPHMVMLAAAAVIAAPRLARRGVLPAPAAQAVMMAGTALVTGHGNTADVEPRPAHGGGGGYGLGEVNSDGVAWEAEEVPHRGADEA
jgi:hypothetical protein